MPQRVILAPKTTEPHDGVGGTGGALPPELQRDTARRLALAAVVTIVVAALYLVYSQVVMPPPMAFSALRLALFPFLLVMSIAILIVSRAGALSLSSLVDVALMYEVLVAACAALLVNEHPAWPEATAVPSWSPVAVWVIVFPLIVPTRAWRTFVASSAAAAMDPLALGLLAVVGAVDIPSTSAVVLRFLPNVAAVVVAVAMVRLLHGLREKSAAERRAGSYRLVERLGTGGVGEVWRAEHRMLDRPAAIKLIRPTIFDDRHTSRQEVVRRFEREVQATANLRSPHTVRIYDFGITGDGDFYYVMELLDGMDLYTMVDRLGPLPPERVVHLARQACDSLQEAHQQGLVHRDIKPGNILPCRYGDRLDFVKVLDFGFVKHQEADPMRTQLTQHGIALGTPAFMPPEVARGDPGVDGRADLYALGCVAYWCLTGRTVFEAPSSMAVMLKHAQAEPTPPSAKSPNRVPAELDGVILSCLAKKPDDRPQTALELSYRLAEIDIEKFWTTERKVLWWATHLPPGRGLAATGEYWIRGESGELMLDRR